MFYLALKRIEAAIASGRLDEAFEILSATPEREHKEGQRVADLLAAKLVRRAEQHLGEDRFAGAKADADKAFRLAGRTEEVSELVQRIAQTEALQKAAVAAERESAQAARIQAQLGLFTLGQNLLPSGPAHSNLATEIERKRKVASDAAGRIERAINSNDFSAGITILNSLDKEIRRHRLVTEQISVIIQPLLEQALAEFKNGRLDRVSDILRLLAPVATGSPPFSELRDSLDRCSRANHFVGHADYADADRELAFVQQIVSDCKWIEQARSTLSELARHAVILRTSPLGLLDGRAALGATRAPNPAPVIASQASPSQASPSQASPSQASPSQAFASQAFASQARTPATDDQALVLRVDGLGTILMLPADLVSIGSYSKSKQYDVPIQTDGPATPLHIRRAGEEYFAESESNFQVNEQPTMQRLLATGDSIAFGRRGRLKFRKSVPASESAVLQLTGAGLRKREIRHVALMADSLLFSSHGGHFALPGCDRPVVVFATAHGYAIKFAGSGGDVSDLHVGHSVLLGETRFTLTQINLS